MSNIKKRSHNLINLALAMSGIANDQEAPSTSNRADADYTQQTSTPCPLTPTTPLPRTTPLIPPIPPPPPPTPPPPTPPSPPPRDDCNYIYHGEDLLMFKLNLRTRPPVNYCKDDSTSSSRKEPFSPDISEYVPSDHNVSEHLSGRTTPLQVQEEALITVEAGVSSEGCTKRVTRNVPKKSNPGRKRELNKENWKRNINKRCRNLGEEYVSRRGAIVQKKTIRSGCDYNCIRKCKDRISEIARHQIFNDFWALGDHSKQVDYVNAFVDRVPRKQIKAPVAGHESRRHWSFNYYLFIDGEKKRVCKKMFLDTLCISDMWLQTIYKKIDKNGTGVVENDLRGHHNNRPNRIPEEIKDSVRSHISLIPHVDSHYVRKRTSKLYFEETLTYPKLYQLYVDWMKQHHATEQVATTRQYKDIFQKEYNIEFHKPKKDLCIICDINKREGCTNEDQEIEYSLHIANKTIVREIKDTCKLQSKQSDIIVTATYDLQKILTTPQSEVTLFYYKRKLAVYNFTIFDIGKVKGYSYIWNETIGKKGSSEISSAVFLFIKQKYEEGFRIFNFFSDCCGGQNRNRIIMGMYSYACKIFGISITHNYFEVGHSQSEGDAMHALIERRKNNQIIYVPEQWITLIRCAKTTGEPYVVTELGQNLILDFKVLLKKKTNWDLDSTGKKVFWSKIKHIKIENGNPDLIYFQYDYLSDQYSSLDLAVKPKARFTRTKKARDTIECEPTEEDDSIPTLYNKLLPISTAKYKDLINLCRSRAIPEIYHNYYLTLPNSTQIDDNDSDD